ncbi:hypothetical protein HETIRDRAFT_431800, partial [Heterobasidion irregulare TC 32-1]
QLKYPFITALGTSAATAPPCLCPPVTRTYTYTFTSISQLQPRARLRSLSVPSLRPYHSPHLACLFLSVRPARATQPSSSV